MSIGFRRGFRRLVASLVAGLPVAGGLAAPILAHGAVPADPPTVLSLVFDWSFEPALLLPLIATAWI